VELLKLLEESNADIRGRVVQLINELNEEQQISAPVARTPQLPTIPMNTPPQQGSIPTGAPGQQ